MSSEQPQVIVVGAGPAGLVAAIALAGAGVPTLVAGQSPADNRTTALLASSVTALETLGAWQRFVDYAAPLRVMRLVDDTGRLWRAPEVKFEAGEIGLDAFGHNIENRHLLDALKSCARELKALEMINERVESVAAAADGVTVAVGGRRISAPLVIGADGRNSICRAAAGIESETRSYPQSALTLSFSHTRPHHDTSTEFHTVSGPFTLVPLPGSRSSLVWVVGPNEADRLAALDDGALSLEIEQRAHSILGKVRVEGARGLFPLTISRGQKFAADRIALVGEAAHVIPPIGAQGLNLGLRDAVTVAELAIDAWRDGRDPGGDDVLAAYDRARRADVGGRSLAIDLLNRSLLTDFLPVQSARGLGLYMMDRIGPLRRAVMREGVAPRAAQPRLMRGEAP
jgi:2-octaprenyl-6-methoxyphenol hydroxylase